MSFTSTYWSIRPPHSNPCTTCTQVHEPKYCARKGCPDWKAWWLPRWEQTCLTILRLLNKKEKDNT